MIVINWIWLDEIQRKLNDFSMMIFELQECIGYKVDKWKTGNFLKITQLWLFEVSGVEETSYF